MTLYWNVDDNTIARTFRAPVRARSHAHKVVAPAVVGKRDWRFWCIIMSLAICILLTAIEFSSVGTALPVITEDLKGSDFIWVGAAYNLGSTALLPFCGGLAQIFGRRSVMLGAIGLFSIGSAVCGSAGNINTLIIGRGIQGLGAGGITALIQIIIGDLVPLKDRGLFNGIMALAFGLGGGCGPVIGGAFAQSGQWRWLFFMNLPVCVIAATLVAIFLRLKTPRGPLKEKLRRIDWIGNFLVVGSTTSMVIALTWAGTEFAWLSAQVVVPLSAGLVGLSAFLAYEALYPEYPIVPISLMNSVTAVSGYLQNFANAVVLSATAFWLPLYFQACKDASPIAAGVDVFGMTYTLGPVAVLAGLVVQRSGLYRQPMWLGWIAIIIGTVLLTRLDENSTRTIAFILQIILGFGMGTVYVAAYFPVLAPISVEQNAPALAFFVFLRNFALIYGVTIGGSILQNQLSSNLPATFVQKFPGGTQIAFEIIPFIPSIEQPLRDQVRHAFAKAFQVMWAALAGVACFGFLASLPMKRLPLHTSVDSNWGRDDEGAGERLISGRDPL
ncbi:major facilitator superfamily domain-containing protein [Mycena pura]|uniref:Major facilitator superfamily domain-containing protein n=1 Tax=Mycena pura TaxID=153505 RepID=A0AAD6VSR5_9AGAR|nr:major facilitator superfamily domain-containing protein [Mycena pura]KAJ7218483.1 major facilitator superfamily domain-containing protein [Mycena pura]